MVNKLLEKLKCKKGSGNAIITIFIIVAIFNIIYLVYSRDHSQYKWWIRTFEEGLRSSSKAALLQYDYSVDNFEMISQGYVVGEDGFNHFIELNHEKANDTFFKMLHTSAKELYTINELKQHVLIAILEPKRIKDSEGNYLKDQWEYNWNLYENDINIHEEILLKDELYLVESLINSEIPNININLSYGEHINKLKPRTYYIAIIENLPLKGLFMYSDKRNVDLFYFEGVNAVRSLDIREGN